LTCDILEAQQKAMYSTRSWYVCRSYERLEDALTLCCWWRRSGWPKWYQSL